MVKAAASKPGSKTPGADTIVSVKVALRDTKPPIWRRVLVPESLSLGGLHEAIQAAMGWDNTHLHAFEIDGQQYGEKGMLEDAANEDRVTLKSLITSGVKAFGYTYDFGDDWSHAVTLEKTRVAGAGQAYPLCVAGKRACPPEDCGGPWGYEELVDILADPAHPDHAEKREWVEDDFDPERFDLVVVNARLADRFAKR